MLRVYRVCKARKHVTDAPTDEGISTGALKEGPNTLYTLHQLSINLKLLKINK